MAKTPNRPSRPRRTGRLLLVTATLVGLAAVPAAAAVTAPTPPSDTLTIRPTQQKPPANPSSHDGNPVSVHERVAHFYAAYVDVANDPGDNTAAVELRKFYLTSGLRARLAEWERRHEADGVLMAQNAPTAWKVTSGDSGMGHTWSTVRLTWGTGKDRTYTYLSVQSDLATRKVSDIKATY